MLFGTTYYGYGNAPFVLSDLQCNGNEDHLLDCPQLNSVRTCGDHEDAAVICQVQEGTIYCVQVKIFIYGNVYQGDFF